MMTNPLSQYFLSNHPKDAARLLEKHDTVDLVEYTVQIPDKVLAEIFLYMNPAIVNSCLCSYETEKAVSVLELFSIERAALLLRRMPAKVRFRLLRKMSALTKNMLKLVLRYPEGTAGQITDPNVLTINMERTISEMINTIQSNYQQVHSRIYILDDDQHLVGMVNVQDVLINDPETPLRKIMSEPESSISARDSLVNVRENSLWRDKDYLPVIDQSGKFIGILKRSVMLDALTKDYSDTRYDNGIVESVMLIAEIFWDACANMIAPQYKSSDKGQKNE